MAVPYTFGTATAAIPLSQLDSNFATAITIGNTAVQLGNTVTTLNNMTLANVTISSGTITITNVAVTTANVSGTANISTLVVVGNETVGGNTTITGNITSSTLTSGRVTYATTSGRLTDSANLLYSGTDLTVYGLTVGRGAGAVSTNTAVGASALAANTTGDRNTAFGNNALYSNAGGTNNVALGDRSAYLNSSGISNTAVGGAALYANINGSNNVAIGRSALESSTASNNTAVGYQAGYTNQTGASNTFLGYQAGYTSASGLNTLIGWKTGYSLTTGTNNTFVGVPGPGDNCGSLITSGSKNTIIGAYTGNQGGLDIRIASNYIVLSDGDGNPSAHNTPSNAWVFGTGTATDSGDIFLNAVAANNQGPAIIGRTGAIGSTTTRWYTGSNSWVKGGTTYDTYTVMAGNTGGVNLANGATAWASASDERLKDIIEPITDAANKVSTLRAVIGKYKTDEEGTRRSFLIAQDVQAVLPEAVTEGRNSKDDETEYLQVAYTEVIPLLVAAIKELKAEIDSLKSQLNGA